MCTDIPVNILICFAAGPVQKSVDICRLTQIFSRHFRRTLPILTLPHLGELLFGTLLLYLFRVFERHWGTPKFAAYAFLSSITSLLVHLGLFIIFKPLPVWFLRCYLRSAATRVRILVCVHMCRILCLTHQGSLFAVPVRVCALPVTTLFQQFSQLRPGPYGLIFALLWRYIVEIPAISKFTIFGASLSDKIFVYLLATQVVFSRWFKFCAYSISATFLVR